MNPVFSIVIPVYNNASTLHAIVSKIAETMKQMDREYEIIFIDDKSPDNSREILTKLASAHSNIRTVFFDKNVGQWEATLRGLAFAKGRYLVTIDADLQYEPEDILKLYQHLRENNFLLVYGIPSRMIQGPGGLRNRIQNFFLKKSVTSSFKILDRSVVFDEQEKFVCTRHFESHEKFRVSRSRKGWIKVNTRGKEGGGFRRHVYRNMNLMFTYLPEYDLYFRHPLVFTGLGMMVLSVLLLVILAVFTDVSFWYKFPLLLLFVMGLMFSAAGTWWKLKYQRIARDRKYFLATLGS